MRFIFPLAVLTAMTFSGSASASASECPAFDATNFSEQTRTAMGLTWKDTKPGQFTHGLGMHCLTQSNEVEEADYHVVTLDTVGFYPNGSKKATAMVVCGHFRTTYNMWTINKRLSNDVALTNLASHHMSSVNS